MQLYKECATASGLTAEVRNVLKGEWMQELNMQQINAVRNACLAATAAKSYTIIYLQRKLGLPEHTLPKLWHKVSVCVLVNWSQHGTRTSPSFDTPSVLLQGHSGL